MPVFPDRRKDRSTHVATAVALLVFVIAMKLNAGGFGKGMAEVEADKLEVEYERKRALFEGNVSVKYSEINLKCEKLVLTYTDKGNIVTLVATGKVVVNRGDVRATASSATLDAVKKKLVLEGKPLLLKGQNRLEGARIEIHLDSSNVDVFDARGRFAFGEGVAD